MADLTRRWRHRLALDFGAMAAETATIRVSRETRDLLARQAGRRGLSVAAMLADLARAQERGSAFRSEREASRADAGHARDEERDWDAVAGDGID